MGSKLIMFFVAMTLSVGFMHYRYSKLNEKMQVKAAADKARIVDANFERLDFGTAAVDDDNKRGIVESCQQARGRYLSYRLAENHFNDFCRCLAVHYVEHVYPLVEANCRMPGRIDFAEGTCAVLNKNKPHQVEDRVTKIGDDCAAWVKAEIQPGATPPAAPPAHAEAEEIKPPPASTWPPAASKSETTGTPPNPPGAGNVPGLPPGFQLPANFQMPAGGFKPPEGYVPAGPGNFKPPEGYVPAPMGTGNFKPPEGYVPPPPGNFKPPKGYIPPGPNGSYPNIVPSPPEGAVAPPPVPPKN